MQVARLLEMPEQDRAQPQHRRRNLFQYRQPLSEYFTRSAFAKRWNATPFAEKEAVAADMRRNLVRIRNEAARSDPASSPPGGPC